MMGVHLDWNEYPFLASTDRGSSQNDPVQAAFTCGRWEVLATYSWFCVCVCVYLLNCCVAFLWMLSMALVWLPCKYKHCCKAVDCTLTIQRKPEAEHCSSAASAPNPGISRNFRSSTQRSSRRGQAVANNTHLFYTRPFKGPFKGALQCPSYKTVRECLDKMCSIV